MKTELSALLHLVFEFEPDTLPLCACCIGSGAPTLRDLSYLLRPDLAFVTLAGVLAAVDLLPNGIPGLFARALIFILALFP